MIGPVPADRHYSMAIWDGDRKSFRLRQAWQSLSAHREEPGALFRSAKFFDYLTEAEPEVRLDVLVVEDVGAGEIVGVVPTKISLFELPFTLGNRIWWRLRLKRINILGSEPLVPETPEVYDGLFLTLSQRYPDAQVVYMDAVPLDSRLWQHIRTSRTVRRLYHIHVMHGFRQCHSVLVPSSIDAYRKKLGRKRRYNFMRQERLLQERIVSPLRLKTIEAPDEVPQLFEAMRQLKVSQKDHSSLSDREYACLSAHGFLLCFVLAAEDTVIGLVIGTRYGKTYKVHRIYYNEFFEKFSPGTTLWQIVFRNIIEKAEFSKVDMGFGTPAYQYRATNMVETRGRVLLFRRTFANRCRIFAHATYSSAVDFVKRRVFGDFQEE